MAVDPLDAADWLDSDELALDLDTQFKAAALALGMAGALLTGEDATAGMVDLMALWPPNVPPHAGVIGYRVAMILAETHDLSAEHLGEVAAALLTPDQEAGSK